MHCSLNNVTLFFFVTEKHTIVYVGHIFLIHSSVDGHLGCFQNSFCIVYSVYCATVNIDIQGSLCVFNWNPLGKYPRVIYLAYMLSLCPFFSGSFIIPKLKYKLRCLQVDDSKRKGRQLKFLSCPLINLCTAVSSSLTLHSSLCPSV